MSDDYRPRRPTGVGGVVGDATSSCRAGGRLIEMSDPLLGERSDDRLVDHEAGIARKRRPVGACRTRAGEQQHSVVGARGGRCRKDVHARISDCPGITGRGVDVYDWGAARRMQHLQRVVGLVEPRSPGNGVVAGGDVARRDRASVDPRLRGGASGDGRSELCKSARGRRISVVSRGVENGKITSKCRSWDRDVDRSARRGCGV